MKDTKDLSNKTRIIGIKFNPLPREEAFSTDTIEINTYKEGPVLGKTKNKL